jgi:hypothetical protein
VRALTSSQIMRIWEEGQHRSLVQRALIILSHACPEQDGESLGRLSVGERDSRLLIVRELTLGSHLSSLATCPQCSEKLELNFSVADILSTVPDGLGNSLYESDEFCIELRLPACVDLENLLPGADARTQLIERCVISARRHGASIHFREIPRAQLDALAERMGEMDPRADVKAALACPSCEHRWQAVFDIVAFFWEELGDQVRRILRDVHVLASAYGWRESDVLGLSPWRRQHYLDLVRQCWTS